MEINMKKRVIAVLMLLTLFLLPLQSFGAEVTDVELKRTGTEASGGLTYRVLGKTSKGKTVWTYSSSRTGAGQYDPVSIFVSGDLVYILDGTKTPARFLKLKKNTGKILKKKSVKNVSGSSVINLDNRGYLIVAARDGRLARITDSGKVLWTVPQEGGGAYKIDVIDAGGTARVFYEYGEVDYIDYRIKDGKRLS
jgi:hypothetical protein